MPIEWDEIHSKWLLGLPNRYEKNELMQAFKMVEKKYGSSFYQLYNFFRGQYFSQLVFDLSTILNEEEQGLHILPINGEIDNTIKQNEVYKSFNLIGLMAHFIRNNLQVKSEPTILVNNKEKKPDFKVHYKDNWIYFEETKYEISDRQKELNLILKEICEMLGEIQRSIKIEVTTLTDIDENNIKQIKEIVQNQCLVTKQPQVLEVPNLVTVVTYEEGQEKPLIDEVRPAQGMATAIIGSGFVRNLNVLIPFSDSRIRNMLVKKNQLSLDNHNIIVTDLSNSGDMKRISEILEEIMIEKEHISIGAFLLIQKRYYINEMKTDYTLLINRNAKKSIPSEIILLLKKYFDAPPLSIRKIKRA